MRTAAMPTETNPLVSVIVRSMGRAELHEALDSVAMQTYPAIEVVVVNAVGAQHPPLGERCGRFPLRLIGSGDRLQRSAAGNYGLRYARGQYLILLDEDDWFLDSHIARLVAQLQQFPHARLAYAGVRGVCRQADGSWQELRVFNEPYSATRLLLQNYIPMHAALFERSLIEAGCRLDETLERYEDWDLWMQIAQHTPFLHLDEVTAVYRSGEASGFGINGDEAVMKRWEIAVFEKMAKSVDHGSVAEHRAIGQMQYHRRRVGCAETALHATGVAGRRTTDAIAGPTYPTRAAGSRRTPAATHIRRSCLSTACAHPTNGQQVAFQSAALSELSGGEHRYIALSGTAPPVSPHNPQARASTL